MRILCETCQYISGYMRSLASPYLNKKYNKEVYMNQRSLFSRFMNYQLASICSERHIDKLLKSLGLSHQKRHIQQSRILLANLQVAKVVDNHWISYGSVPSSKSPKRWSHQFAHKFLNSDLCEKFPGSNPKDAPGHVARFRLKKELPQELSGLEFRKSENFSLLRRKDEEAVRGFVGSSKRERTLATLNILNLQAMWEIPQESLEAVVFPDNETPFVNLARTDSYRTEDGDWRPFGATSYYSKFCRGQRSGGRFYNGLSNLPRVVREELLVGGQPTVELDFRSLHPRLLYLENSPNQDTKYLVDIYAILSNGTGLERDDAKKLWNIALNCRQHHREELEEQSLQQSDLNKVVEFIEKGGLKPFTDPSDLFSDKGVKFQRVDSEIALNVLESFVEADRPILSWHDSFRVAFRDKQRLEDVMRSAFETVTGTALPAEAISRM